MTVQPGKKLSQLGASASTLLTTPADGDLIPILDISEPVVAYQTKVVTVSNLVKKNNFAATAAPTTANDSSQGYAVGSRWDDITNDKSYECLDATVGAAVWMQTGGVDSDHYAGGQHHWLNVGTRSGLLFSKSIPHNSATTLAVITMSVPGTTGVFLISVTGLGANTLAAGAYLLTVAWSDVQIGVLGTVAKFGTTTYTLSAAVDTGTGKITLTLTQANSSTEAQTTNVAVLPLMVYEGTAATITVAGT